LKYNDALYLLGLLLNFVAGGSKFASLPPQYVLMIKEKQNTVISSVLLVIYHLFLLSY
jgi:hypothetical protein